jgi:hypothetical protein
MSLPPDLRSRLLAEVARTASPTRAQRRARSLGLTGAAVAFMLLAFVAVGGPHPGARPEPFLSGISLGWLLVAAGAGAGVLYRGRTMLGPSRRRLVLTILVAPLLLVAWTVLWNRLYPEALQPWPGRLGWRCFGLTLLLAAAPLLALVLTRRASVVRHPGWLGAAGGIALTAAAGLLVVLYCPIANPAHTALGHFGPFLILGLTGAALGRRWLDVGR